MILAFIVLHVCRHWLPPLMTSLLSITCLQRAFLCSCAFLVPPGASAPSEAVCSIFFYCGKSVILLDCLYLALVAGVDLSFVLHFNLCSGYKNGFSPAFSFHFFPALFLGP